MLKQKTTKKRTAHPIITRVMQFFFVVIRSVKIPLILIRTDLVIVSALIGIAAIFLAGKIFACAASVAEFLLIAGGTGTVTAFFPVIFGCTGERKPAVMFFAHKESRSFSLL